MNFSPSDINAAVRRGIGPKDPRFAGFIQKHRQERVANLNDSRVRGILHNTTVVATYPTASAWLREDKTARAPIWLGHDPETTIHERGTKRFIHFAAKGTHQATVFEILGNNFRRIL